MSPREARSETRSAGRCAVRGLLVGAAVGCLVGVVFSAYNPFFVDSLWLGLLSLWAAPAVLGALLWTAGNGVRRLIVGGGSGRAGVATSGRAPAPGLRSTIALFLLALVVAGLYVVRHLSERSPSHLGRGPRILIVGIDGATWDIMDPLMEANQLPNFQALRANGSSGVLTSINPTLSPAVWTTIATGKLRAKHGIMDFTYTQEDLRAPRIWELLEGEGKTVGMMSWLVTWPPAVRNGFMIPGWLARTPATHPPNLHFALDIILGEGLARTPREYLAYIVEAPRIGVRISTLFEAFKVVSFSKLRKPPMLDLVHRKENLKGRIFSDIFCWLLVNHRPDFSAAVFYGTDSLAHVYWKYMQAADASGGSPATEPKEKGAWDVAPEDAARYGDVIRDYYRLVDSFLPKILSLLPEETTVCVLSDHGHGPSETDWGYLIIKANKLIETLGIQDKVSVASVGDWSFLSAAPGSSPERLAEAVEVLSALMVDGKGMPFLDIKAKESATLSIRIADGVEQGDTFSAPDGRSFRVADYVDRTDLSGTHRLEGVIILAGPGVQKGYKIQNASIADVTPTLLHLMGSTVGEDMDGRVLTECLEEGFMKNHPVRFVETRDGEVALPSATPGEGMPEAVRERLRALGYVK